ncbi:MAG: alpha/beta fold hydrolase [Actinomycetota bacterium]
MFVVRPDGCRLYVEHHGEPAAPPLLLLEGMGGDLPGWRRNIPTLSAAAFVIAFDHRGNGRSDDPAGPVDMATFVADACAVLDDAGAADAHVYGQSFGGMVAQEMALTRADRVRSLILACTHAGRAYAVATEAGSVPKGEPWRALYAPGFPDAHPEHVAEDLRSGASGPHHPAGQRRQWEAMQEWSAFERLGDIAAPTLVLHGTADQVVAPGNAEVLASRISNAELVWLEGAGHVYHSERAEEADRVVLRFMERHQ